MSFLFGNNDESVDTELVIDGEIQKLPTYEAIQEDSDCDILEYDEEIDVEPKENSLFRILNSYNEEQLDLEDKQEDVSTSTSIRSFKISWLNITMDIIPELEQTMMNFFT